MRVTCTIRQQLGVRVRQIFKKLKSRDIKRYQPINIQKFPVMSQPAFSRKLIWNCQKDGCYAMQRFSKLVSLLMITLLQNKISVLDAIKRHGVTTQVARNLLHKAGIQKFVAAWQGAMPKVESTPTIRNDWGKKREWMRNKLRQIEWCYSPFRTAHESWHNLTKEKIIESKAAKAIQKYVDDSYQNPI